MTSLAKQLNKLAQSAGTSTHGVKVVSLLFNQREAASMDMDDIFDLGLNGLLELTQVSVFVCGLMGSLTARLVDG